MEKKVSKGLVEFLNKSYTAFHAVENIKDRLIREGFTPLSEGEKWNIEKGGKYFTLFSTQAKRYISE